MACMFGSWYDEKMGFCLERLHDVFKIFSLECNIDI